MDSRENLNALKRRSIEGSEQRDSNNGDMVGIIEDRVKRCFAILPSAKNQIHLFKFQESEGVERYPN